MTNAANRGKTAEAKVHAHLKDIAAAHATFDFQRNQDAHSAGGHMSVAQTGDFAAFGLYKGLGYLFRDLPPNPSGSPVAAMSGIIMVSRNFVIEVKEVKHAFRLPYKNFSADKVARIKKRELAGAEGIVLIRFMPADEWRAVPTSFFYERNLDKPSGSWDLSAEPFVDYRTAISELVGMAP